MAKISRTSKSDFRAVLPKRKPVSHKGDFGRLLVVGGSPRYVGAPALTGLAALRSGVDLVTIAAPENVAWAINRLSMDLITLKLPCANLELTALAGIWEELTRSTAVVVGPGLGASEKAHEAAIEIARQLRKEHHKLPALFDADALKALASKPHLTRGMPWVLTPHASEFEILTGRSLPSNLNQREDLVKKKARELGCVILLKSHVDIIASSAGGLKLNYTGNPGMTVGGTGDVLSGVVGTFLAQGADPFRAAAAGAWACGRAGDLCRRQKGYEFTASDVTDKLPEVFKEVRKKR